MNRNQEIGNTPVWIWPNIWRLGRVRNTYFDTNVSTKMLLNAAKCQGYSFYRFWFINGKPARTGVGGKNTPPTQIMVKANGITEDKKVIKIRHTKNVRTLFLYATSFLEHCDYDFIKRSNKTKNLEWKLRLSACW